MKRLLLVLFLAVAIIGIMAIPKINPTKIPYDNGFYSGPYNPKLPKIDPNAK
jgi:hypothetical protein